MDEQPPAALVVVSAEESLANGLNKLGQRGYRVVLIRPPRAALSQALAGTADETLEWSEVTGEESGGEEEEEEGEGAADGAEGAGGSGGYGGAGSLPGRSGEGGFGGRGAPRRGSGADGVPLV